MCELVISNKKDVKGEIFFSSGDSKIRSGFITVGGQHALPLSPHHLPLGLLICQAKYLNKIGHQILSNKFLLFVLNTYGKFDSIS